MAERSTDHLGRDAKDFAIEHAGYLADAVERILKADRSIFDADDWLTLNDRVYEFRKRAARAKAEADPPLAERALTMKCPVTGEQIPAVLVARWSPTLGHVYCPECSKAVRGSRVWHSVELAAEAEPHG